LYPPIVFLYVVRTIFGDPIKNTIGSYFFFIKISIPANLEGYKEFLKVAQQAPQVGQAMIMKETG